MSSSAVASGSLQLAAALASAFGGDTSGQRAGRIEVARTFGASDIQVDGWFKGTMIAAAGDILLAHATDPLGAMGDAAYSDGFAPAGKKLKLLIIRNNDLVNSITVKRKASVGLVIFDTAGAGISLTPGGVYCYLDPTGAGTGALTTGANDALTIGVSGGAPTADVLAVYGS